MATFSTFTFKGDPDELLRIKQSVEPISFPILERHGALAHFYARTDDGLVLFTVWETSDGPQAYNEIGPIGKAAGMPVPTHEPRELVAYHAWAQPTPTSTA